MTEFVYPGRVNLEETIEVDGESVLRYGRLRDRAFQHLGSDAPLRSDGALYDRLNLGDVIMPVSKTALPQTQEKGGARKRRSHAVYVGRPDIMSALAVHSMPSTSVGTRS